MPVIHHAIREIHFKVVYYGSGLGGKTTNLEYIHRHSRAEHRGKLVSMNTESERTLFFDLLPVDLGRFKGYQVRLHLCTVPGQMAHDRTRRMVLRGVDGIVFVVDSQRDRMDDNVASIRNLETNLLLQGDDPVRMPMVIQYNKRDLPTALPVTHLRQVLSVPSGVQEVQAVAARGVGVFDTFKRSVGSCLSLVGEPSEAPEGRTRSVLPHSRHSSMFPVAALGPEQAAEAARAQAEEEGIEVPKSPRVPRVEAT